MSSSNILVRFGLAFIVFVLFAPILQAQDSTKYTFYWGTGCSHCAKVEQFFQENNVYETFIIEEREIFQNQYNLALMQNDMQRLGQDISQLSVPVLVFDDTLIKGDRDIIAHFEALLANNTSNDTEISVPTEQPVPRTSGNLFWLVIGGALVDAVNPCAFAVLIILLTKVLTEKKRTNVLSYGLFFTLAIFISYFLMGIGIYQALATLKITYTLTIVIGVFAILIGLFNVKDYFWYGKWFKMEVPMTWRPNMQKIIKSVTSPFSAFVIGFLVSLFLLPCTSGPYIIVLGMLGSTETFWKAFWYIVLYNIVFVLPMVAITLGTYFGLSMAKTEEQRRKNLKNLHLFAGIIMILMGVWILWRFTLG